MDRLYYYSCFSLFVKGFRHIQGRKRYPAPSVRDFYILIVCLFAVVGIGAYLADVEDHVRVKDLLDLSHKVECSLADGFLEVFLLRVADGVLAGDLTFKLGALGVALVHNDLDLGEELFLGHGVGAAVDMQVAVARVAEVADLYPLLRADLADVDEKVCDPVDRDNDVHLVKKLGVGLDRGQERAARRPYFLLQRRGIDNENVHRADLLGDLSELFHLKVKLIIAVADKRDKDARADGLAAHLGGEDGVAGKRGGAFDDVRVHELNGLRVEIRKLYRGHRRDGVGKLGKGQDQGHIAGGRGDELERKLGDDAEGALGAADQVQQAVAGAGLADGLAELHDLAAREDDGHRHDIVARDAVLDSAHTAGVSADVASDRRGLLAGIGRIEQAVSLSIRREIAEPYADLSMDAEVLHIVAEDLVHARRADNDAAAERNRAADKAGARAARGDGDEVLVAELHNGRDLFSALHLAYRFGEALAVDGHFVVAVVLGNAAVKIESVLTDYRLELFGEFRGDLVVFRHAFISLKYFIFTQVPAPGMRSVLLFMHHSLPVSIP